MVGYNSFNQNDSMTSLALLHIKAEIEIPYRFYSDDLTRVVEI